MTATIWKRLRVALSLALVLTLFSTLWAQTPGERWTEAQANTWYAAQPWPVGANFLPSTAVNELEMWQADTFDEKTIDRELGWAESIGMNTMRVFLHDLLWEQDPKGFTQRINTFLTIAERHHIRPIFVLFDSCWNPLPKLGPQPPPTPGVHNSGWVQAPGPAVLADVTQVPRLENYVKGVVGAFARDTRILAWDIWNEPDNGGSKEEQHNKNEILMDLLPRAFAWARSMHPMQPLTSGVWHGDWTSLDTMLPLTRVQIVESDVISFHNYGWPEEFEERVKQLEQLHRPIICTEYMARGAGSLFDTVLPIAKAHQVGAINWGLVAGKSQTYLPWDSRHKPYVNRQPMVWFHDIFYVDGRPYRQREVEMIRTLTSTE